MDVVGTSASAPYDLRLKGRRNRRRACRGVCADRDRRTGRLKARELSWLHFCDTAIFIAPAYSDHFQESKAIAYRARLADAV